jgi:glutathione S-transferase
MAIAYASINLEVREVSLANKPLEMTQISPKGTVPVLQLDNRIIDESIEVMAWALEQSDPDNWLALDLEQQQQSLIEENDNSFKAYLDKYKYWDRFPEQPQQAYRGQAEQFISRLDKNLSEHRYLLGEKICMADIAIFPFIRQFAFVDKDWFDQANYTALQRWLNAFLELPLFAQVMKKHSVWQSPMNSGA